MKILKKFLKSKTTQTFRKLHGLFIVEKVRGVGILTDQTIWVFGTEDYCRIAKKLSILGIEYTPENIKKLINTGYLELVNYSLYYSNHILIPAHGEIIIK